MYINVYHMYINAIGSTHGIWIWVNYNNSLTWIKAIWRWFPLLTMIPVRSQWGRYNLPRWICIYIYIYMVYGHPCHSGSPLFSSISTGGKSSLSGTFLPGRSECRGAAVPRRRRVTRCGRWCRICPGQRRRTCTSRAPSRWVSNDASSGLPGWTPGWTPEGGACVFALAQVGKKEVGYSKYG